MKRGFYTIMAAQFFSSLADNALLIAAIAMLIEMACPGLDEAAAQAVLHHLVRGAGALRRRLRRLDAQGPGDVDHQRDQGLRLLADVLQRAPAARLRRGRLRRRRVFAGQVRHPDRAAAPGEAGGRQRLDRGHDRRLDHPGHRAGRRADQPDGCRRSCWRSTCPCIDTGIDTPAEAAIADHRRLLRVGRAVQPAHSRHRRPTTRTRSATRQAGHRLRALLPRAVARQAGPDLAGRDHAVLGRGRDAAVHRAAMGETCSWACR